jgi:hypothetical protein
VKTSIFLCFLNLSTFAYLQVNIETPFGFENLFIEMSTTQLIEEMGEPEKIISYEDEKKVWVDGDYSLEKSLIFHIGFDQVYVFDYQNKYCLWKAYIKNNKVVYMNITSRFVEEIYKTQLTIRGVLSFQNRIQEFVDVLGSNFFPDRGFGYTDYLYHDLGIRFTFRQDRMTNVYLFRRFTNKADLFKLVKYFPKD